MAEQDKFNQDERGSDKSAFGQFGDKPQQSQQEADEIRRRKEQEAGQDGSPGQQSQSKDQIQRQQGDQDLGDDSKDSNNLK